MRHHAPFPLLLEFLLAFPRRSRFSSGCFSRNCRVRRCILLFSHNSLHFPLLLLPGSCLTRASAIEALFKKSINPSCPWSADCPPLLHAADPSECAHWCARAAREHIICGGGRPAGRLEFLPAAGYFP